MHIIKDTVVTLTYELLDADGQLIESSEAPVEYLHGGYDGIFPRVEQALSGKSVGERCEDRKSTRLNSSHMSESRMPSSA